MKKIVKLTVIAIVLIILIGSITFYYASTPSSHEFYLIGFDYDEAFIDMKVLTDIGPRVPGTAADLEGAQYVESRFTEAGLSDVHIEEYPVTTFEVNSASLSLITLSLSGQLITNYAHITDFVLYQYSGSTNGDLTLELVDVGNGTDEAFEGLEVDGKAVIATQQILPKAAERGVRAVIVQNLRTGEQLGYPAYSGGLYGGDENGDSIPYPDANPAAILPSCAVSKAVGDELKDAIENARTTPILGLSNVRIRLNFDTTITTNNIYNVVGDVVGNKNPEDMIYIVAHRDTTYINPGAVDNTAGTVTIMELARQLANYNVRKTIRFISMDAEEKGLLGATEYVKAHEAEVMDNGIICLNFDMNDVNLERVDTLNIRISNTGYLDELNEIETIMMDSHPDLREKYILNITEGGGGPDAAPFERRGIDGAFAMGEWGSSWEFHTQWDTIEHVNPESWQLGGILFGALALEIAGVK